MWESGAGWEKGILLKVGKLIRLRILGIENYASLNMYFVIVKILYAWFSSRNYDVIFSRDRAEKSWRHCPQNLLILKALAGINQWRVGEQWS